MHATACTARRDIIEKLDVHSAAEIVLYAVRRGVIR
jgi:DNA-binding CsgD family transcriptional regulator